MVRTDLRLLLAVAAWLALVSMAVAVSVRMIVWDEFCSPPKPCQNSRTVRTIEIQSLWNGNPARSDEFVRLDMERTERMLAVHIDAPFHGDPAPDRPKGRCDRLWEFEVVELFLVGPGDRYVELEFGPHGHYLALQLEGARHVVDDRLPLEYSAIREDRRWRGVAAVPSARLPEPIVKWNAFAIHGTGKARRHLAASPVPGEQPDFHRIESFSVRGFFF